MPDLTTTIGEIKKHNPCKRGAKLFLGTLQKYNDSTEIKLSQVLGVCGVKDAFWVLCVWRYEEYCILCAAVAESVLPLFELRYPKDNRPRNAINEIKLYYHGYSSPELLKVAAYAADAAAAAAADYDAGYAAAAAAAAAATLNAADNAAYAAATTYAAYAATDTKIQWKLMEGLMINFIKK